MLVVFEGADGSGKTTVIQRLKKDFGWEEIEWPGKQPTPQDFVKMCENFMQKYDYAFDDCKIYLMDRCGLGELLYGSIENRLDIYADRYHKWFQKLMQKAFFVFTKNELAHHRAVERGEDGIAKDAIIHEHVTLGYEALYNIISKQGLAVTYDWEKHDYKYLVNSIISVNMTHAMLGFPELKNKEEKDD